MTSPNITQRYNYDAFTPEKYEPWMNFENSPPLGETAPDFPLWQLDDQRETSLKAIWSAQRFTIVEFGSFT